MPATRCNGKYCVQCVLGEACPQTKPGLCPLLSRARRLDRSCICSHSNALSVSILLVSMGLDPILPHCVLLVDLMPSSLAWRTACQRQSLPLVSSTHRPLVTSRQRLPVLCRDSCTASRRLNPVGNLPAVFHAGDVAPRRQGHTTSAGTSMAWNNHTTQPKKRERPSF